MTPIVNSPLISFLHGRPSPAEALVAGQVGALGRHGPGLGSGLLLGQGELDTDQGPRALRDAASVGQDLGELLPELAAHAAVHGEVERAGEAHEGVDGQDDEVGHIVIHPVPRLIKHSQTLSETIMTSPSV